MKKIFFVILLIAIIQSPVFAQDSSRSTYRITTSVLQDAQLYFTLTFEKVLAKKTIGFSLGFKPSTQDSGTPDFNTGPASTYQMNNFYNDLYNSFTLSFFEKFYFGEQHKSFIMPVGYYRLWWFDTKNASFTGEGGRFLNSYDYSYNGTRSEAQQIGGLSIFYGRTYKLNNKGSVKPIIEPFVGLGLALKSYRFETINGTVNNIYYKSYLEQDIGLYPSIHVGLNIGVEFSTKNKK